MIRNAPKSGCNLFHVLGGYFPECGTRLEKFGLEIEKVEERPFIIFKMLPRLPIRSVLAVLSRVTIIVTVITVSCIIASDVGAYAFGKTFGKHRLIAVSPNKTVEGALGGLTCTMATAYGLRWLLGWHAGPVQTLVLGAVIFVAAVAGDLMESVMKRNAGMKDSGDIIPGHGGFLDRFDSYMFTGIAAYFYVVTVMPHWFLGMTL